MPASQKAVWGLLIVMEKITLSILSIISVAEGFLAEVMLPSSTTARKVVRG